MAVRRMTIRERREAAARAVAREMGWDYSGRVLIDDESPRAKEFVRIADAVLDAAKSDSQ